MQQGNKYLLQHQSKRVRAVIKQVHFKIDVNTLAQQQVDEAIKLNEVAAASIKTAVPLVYDAYEKLKQNGNAILIDETSNSTVAAVLFR